MELFEDYLLHRPQYQIDKDIFEDIYSNANGYPGLVSLLGRMLDNIMLKCESVGEKVTLNYEVWTKMYRQRIRQKITMFPSSCRIIIDLTSSAPLISIASRFDIRNFLR